MSAGKEKGNKKESPKLERERGEGRGEREEGRGRVIKE